MPDCTLSIDKVLHRILKPDGNALFYVFSNADNKRWIMPAQHSKTALNLYQPSSLKGKWMKRLFPLLKKFPLFRSKLGIEIKTYALSDELVALLQQLFQKDTIEFSMFCGTPSVHQKITIQISTGKDILGYCKVSDQEDIKAIFKHEQQVLGTLKMKGVIQIPECIYCGSLVGDIDLFVQTTTKTSHSVIVHQMTKQHWDFLIHLFAQTKHPLPFEESDFCFMLERLSKQLKHLPENDAPLVSAAIGKVKNHFANKPVLFSNYQGDFTPWNMFVEKGKLFVFDWEYSKSSYPPLLDAYHFFTQTCIYEKKMNAEAIFTLYITQKNTFAQYIENPDLFYQCYLLGIIGLYTDRDNGIFNDNIKHLLNVWIHLIRLLPDAAN